MPEQKYDKAYFIAKFEAIPDELWTVGKLTRSENGAEQHCALGHAGAQKGPLHTEESEALCALFSRPAGYYPDDVPDPRTLTAINDGARPRYQQPTPKARILAALKDLPDLP